MNLSIAGLAILLITAPAFAAPDDMDDAHQALKEAVQAKKDAAEVKKLAAEAYALAHQLTTRPAPEGDAQKEAWTGQVAHAREIESYTEYALYTAAIQGPAATTVDLLSIIEQQNPKSKYLDEGYSRYFVALSQTGGASKILAVAEKALANFPNNEDLLLVLANSAMNRKQSDRALSYAQRLVAAIGQHPKPEGISSADWERKRNAALGRGNWIAGVISAEKTKYAPADKYLRAALPLIKDNEEMTASALFYLGLANFQLGKLMLKKAQVLEAAKFSEQVGAMNSPLAQQARHNARVMRDEATKMR